MNASLNANGKMFPSRMTISAHNSIQMKNRIHKELESACIKISSVLSDIFGVAGMKIINGLLEGKNIDEILKLITSKRILKKEQELRKAVTNSLDFTFWKSGMGRYIILMGTFYYTRSRRIRACANGSSAFHGKRYFRS